MTVRVRFCFLLSNDNAMLNKVTNNLRSMILLPDLQMNNNPEHLELPLSVVCFSHDLKFLRPRQLIKKAQDQSQASPRENCGG